MGTLTSILSLTSEGEEARCANDREKPSPNPGRGQSEGSTQFLFVSNLKGSGIIEMGTLTSILSLTSEGEEAKCTNYQHRTEDSPPALGKGLRG